MASTVDTVETTKEQRRAYDRRWRNRTTSFTQPSAEKDTERPIVWGAVAAGVVLALALQLALGLAGYVTGFVSTGGDAVTSSATWLLASAVLAVFVGGALASRLADVARRDGLIHGLLTWGLVSIAAAGCVSLANGRVVRFGGQPPVDAAPATMKDVADIDRQAALIAIGAAPEGEPTLRPPPSVATTTAAYWALGALLASAIAGAAGGYVGAPRWVRRRTVLVA